MAQESEPISQTLLEGQVADLIASGALNHDPAQAQAIAELDILLGKLSRPRLGNKQSALGWMFGKKPARDDIPRGVYMWGGVGRGKSMLMDMFYNAAITEPRRRVHFHAFMQDVHGRIHKWRQEQKTATERSADPIPPLAEELAKEAKLLCFDEFAVTDVADAMLLARLFTRLFENGVTVVATSNVDPDLLYKDGLNRSFFLPFIELVKTKMGVLRLDGEVDHRMEKIINSDVYFVDDISGFEALWDQMVGDKDISPTALELKGREVKIEKAAGGVARIHFDDLCRKPLGAGDYLALAERFHTLFLQGLPVMEIADRNAVKRFINFIDAWYDNGRVLIVEAEDGPAKLYPVDHGTEAFEFDRTVSRLREMQGDDWLNSRNNP